MSKFIMDTTNIDDVSTKVTDEKETRKKFLTVAKWAGREREMLLVFAKFDKMQRECTDTDKARDIAKYGAVEVYKLLGECFASLKSNGALVIPGLESHMGELWVDGELVYRDK